MKAIDIFMLALITGLAFALFMDVLPYRRKYQKANAELEIERMRLAACGVVAMANTPESAANAREMHPNYWSASCADVAKAVDREMEWRDHRAAKEYTQGFLRAKEIYSGDGALTFSKLRDANVTRCVKWHPDGIRSWSPSDWLTAALGEMGELASLIKMRNRERDGLPGNKFSPTDRQVADELADVLIYLDLFAAYYDIDIELAIKNKFNEVSERVGFPDRL